MLCVQLADIVAARAKDGKNYGIILLPEGLIEHVPEVGLMTPHPGTCAWQLSASMIRSWCISVVPDRYSIY